MNEILIVPDVHGRNFWTPALDYPGEIIFLGDYTDPYSFEGFSDEDALQGLLKIVKFKQQNPDRVILLIGNHELHYYNSDFQAGRFSDRYYPRFHEILTGDDTKNLFQMCKQIDNYLFIHAGITKGWYDKHLADFKDLGATLEEQMNKVFIEKPAIFHEAARKYRGGFDESGSPLWADVHEFFDEPEHFDDNLIQIIGHSQIREPDPIIKGNVRMLDNRQLYVLRDGVIEKYAKTES